MNAINGNSNTYWPNTGLSSVIQNKHKLPNTEANKALESLVSSSEITSDQESSF